MKWFDFVIIFINFSCCMGYSNQVNQFISAVGQFGAGRYIGLTIGNEVVSVQ